MSWSAFGSSLLRPSSSLHTSGASCDCGMHNLPRECLAGRPSQSQKCLTVTWPAQADLREKGRFEIEAEVLSKAIATATVPVLQVVAVHLRFKVLIREYYRDCGQMDTESGQSLESGRQSRLTSDAAPSGLHMVGWGLQSDRLYNMHSPDSSFWQQRDQPQR
ncbi:hypothetical protein V500_02306 [Pseudogymnoascus sp. VKM F-4518 (FW-2643)]|nr:hypothetical protein V500_02306 [Pseudogymnoascus sp. VKM F-4518 (FW-2643)]